MRALLSNLLLTIFIVVFAVPLSALAQPTWTPPTGPALGNNVASPLNISAFPQSKEGDLEVSNGNYKFLNSGFGFFKPGVFLSNIWFGSANTFPVFNFTGKIIYNGKNSNGQPIALAPQPGYVLKSTDTFGTLGWGPATGLPPGVNNGDILVWNSNTNTWESVVNEGDLPDGVNPGDILIWNSTLNVWEAGPNPNGPTGTSMPPGTAGQTMWYNGGTNAWEATNMIKHTTVGSAPIRTTIGNNVVVIPGPDITIGSNNSTVPFAPANTKIQSNRIDLGSASVGSNVNLVAENVNFEKLSGTQNTIFKSDSVKFKGPANNPTALDPGAGRIPFSTDNDGSFKWNKNLYYLNSLIGPVGMSTLVLQTPNIADMPGSSLALTAFVNQGISLLQQDVTIQGNTRITNTGDLFLDGIDSYLASSASQYDLKHLCINASNKKVMLCDPSGLPGGFVGNDDDGGNDGSQVSQTFYYENNLDPDQDGISSRQLTFPLNGPVTITYCGAGGGGGGGGVGAVIQQNSGVGGAGSVGNGGAGGQGGLMGQCNTVNQNVTAGQVLTMEIGDAGKSGIRSIKNFDVTYASTDNHLWNPPGPQLPWDPINEPTLLANPLPGEEFFYNYHVWINNLGTLYPSTNGSNGKNTRILINGTQLSNISLGGGGGGRAGDSVNGYPGIGGGVSYTPADNSNQFYPGPNYPAVTASNPNFMWWNTGGYGCTTANNGSPGCGNSWGGLGGTGQKLGLNGTINAPTFSGRGAQGVNGPNANNQIGNANIGEEYWMRWGGNGGNGSHNSDQSLNPGGGGGGGGSYGFPSVFRQGGFSVTQMRGGNGGKGGVGYVKVTYMTLNPGSSGSSQSVFNNQGAAFFDLYSLPPGTETITIKMWGGGGGGGAISGYGTNSNSTFIGGGGGSGGFREGTFNFTQTARNCISNHATAGCPSDSLKINFTVGSGGSVGVSSPGGAPVSATAGANTRLTGVSSVPGSIYTNFYQLFEQTAGFSAMFDPSSSVTAGQPGGNGGASGAAGAGASFVINGFQGTPGVSGQTGALGGLGGTPITSNSVGYGRGGNGSRYQPLNGIGSPVSGSAGQPGAVVISW